MIVLKDDYFQPVIDEVLAIIPICKSKNEAVLAMAQMVLALTVIWMLIFLTKLF